MQNNLLRVEILLTILLVAYGARSVPILIHGATNLAKWNYGLTLVFGEHFTQFCTDACTETCKMK